MNDAPTNCDLASLFLDAKKRLPEEIKQDIGTIKSDEYEYRLMVFFSDNKIMIYYEPALLNEDSDLLIVSAGRTAALYDDKTCDFLEIKSQR
ncbi:MAG: hypothetical protein DHS20C04_01000 [Hyphococcus sp.]|nr:MAG: hypothetical protein DHS20C04_01000 [Marinicaulis sp.]